MPVDAIPLGGGDYSPMTISIGIMEEEVKRFQRVKMVLKSIRNCRIYDDASQHAASRSGRAQQKGPRPCGRSPFERHGYDG
jgi:hypothetical protein